MNAVAGVAAVAKKPMPGSSTISCSAMPAAAARARLSTSARRTRASGAASSPPSGAAVSTTPWPCAAMSAMAGSPRSPLTSLIRRAPLASAAAATAARVVSADSGTETAGATTPRAHRMRRTSSATGTAVAA